MNVSTIGLFVGLALGFAWASRSFTVFLVTALGGLIGLIVGKVLEGELDLTSYLSGRGGRDRR